MLSIKQDGIIFVADYCEVEKLVNDFISEELLVDRLTTSSTIDVMNLPDITFTPGEHYDPTNIHVISILNNKGKVISRFVIDNK